MIHITKTPNADSRVAGMDIALEDLKEATGEHILHVREGLYFFSDMLMNAAEKHDYTKLSEMEAYHRTLTTLTPGSQVKASPWYKMHISKERHHLLSKAPDDVNLVDILEYVTDCVMAGLSRTGEVSPLELSDELLQNAFKNTVELLKTNVELTE